LQLLWHDIDVVEKSVTFWPTQYRCGGCNWFELNAVTGYAQ